jgi:hypothetical protein
MSYWHKVLGVGISAPLALANQVALGIIPAVGQIFPVVSLFFVNEAMI